MFQPKIFPKSPKFSPGVPALPAGFRDSVEVRPADLVTKYSFTREATNISPLNVSQYFNCVKLFASWLCRCVMFCVGNRPDTCRGWWRAGEFTCFPPLHLHILHIYPLHLLSYTSIPYNSTSYTYLLHLSLLPLPLTPCSLTPPHPTYPDLTPPPLTACPFSPPPLTPPPRTHCPLTPPHLTPPTLTPPPLTPPPRTSPPFREAFIKLM